MRILIRVMNTRNEEEHRKVLDTAKMGAPEIPVQVLIKAGVNECLGKIEEWSGRTLTVQVD